MNSPIAPSIMTSYKISLSKPLLISPDFNLCFLLISIKRYSVEHAVLCLEKEDTSSCTGFVLLLDRKEQQWLKITWWQSHYWLLARHRKDKRRKGSWDTQGCQSIKQTCTLCIHSVQTDHLNGVSVCWCNLLHWTALKNAAHTTLFLPFSEHLTQQQQKLKRKKILQESEQKVTQWPSAAALCPSNWHKEINFLRLCPFCTLPAFTV